MGNNPLKPRKDDLIQNLSSYRADMATPMDALEFEVLCSVCQDVDRAMRVVTKSALEYVLSELKLNLICSLTLDASEMPMATSIGNNDAYRISIPISFIHKLLLTAATREGLKPSCESDYYLPSVFIAALAAYAHELNHIFTGHLTMESSSDQEANSDLRSGGLTWVWLQRQDIRELCKIPQESIEHNCVYGFLHLVSIMRDAENLHSNYPPRAIRYPTYCSGAANYADQSSGGDEYGTRILAAILGMPACPDSRYKSEHIDAEHYSISQLHSIEELTECINQIDNKIQANKPIWYKASEHLRPIKRAIMRILKRDTHQ